jgi:hypothetical protein
VDRNPLRRGIDRVERAIWILLALGVLAAAPNIMPMVGHVVRADSLAEVRLESSWREVNAVLLRHAPPQPYGYSANGTVWVSGRWRAPSGRPRVGLVPTEANAPAGTQVKVWVTKGGRLTGTHPLTAGLVGARVVGSEMLVVLGLALTALILGGLLRWLLNRRRMACWGSEWACFGPRWSSRRL